ncbi:MAG TPA: hypothetical protein GX708_23355 [Gallicola sp.]|nr:hypothetical protein [Gallicola sp.]
MLEDNVDEKYYLSNKMIDYLECKSGDAGNYDRSSAYRPLNEDSDYAWTINTRAGSRPTDNFIKVHEATKQGYALATDGDGVYINRPHQKRGVVQKGKIQTLKTTVDDIGVVVKDNLKSKLCNDLIEKGIAKENDVIKHSYTGQIMDGNKKCIEMNNLMPTMTTRPDCLGVTVKDNSNLRIRKLTPKECFRLMGVKDEDYERIAQNQSNSSLYHLAGDSIVVNVLMAIFKELLRGD